jgi:hypothetical protein
MRAVAVSSFRRGQGHATREAENCAKHLTIRLVERIAIQFGRQVPGAGHRDKQIGGVDRPEPEKILGANAHDGRHSPI